jgi:hypothetical protein
MRLNLPGTWATRLVRLARNDATINRIMPRAMPILPSTELICECFLHLALRAAPVSNVARPCHDGDEDVEGIASSCRSRCVPLPNHRPHSLV